MLHSNNKAELRASALAIRNGFDEAFITSASKRACKYLSKTLEFSRADTILIYYPIKNEISPLPLIRLAQKESKRIAFPICNIKNNTLSFKEINEISELKQTSLGTFEPNEAYEDIVITENTLCVVPALLFSRDGYRLGYGKGYYDRFLRSFNGTSVGLSYDELLCEYLPIDSHDISLNIIITESEVHYIAQKN